MGEMPLLLEAKVDLEAKFIYHLVLLLVLIPSIKSKCRVVLVVMEVLIFMMVLLVHMLKMDTILLPIS